MTGMKGNQFVELLASHAETRDLTQYAQKFEVSSIDSTGMLVLRELVTNEIISEPFACVGHFQYAVGMEVMAIPVSESEWFVLGPVQRSAPTLTDHGTDYVGRMYTHVVDATSADVTSTPNTATFVALRTTNMPILPAGTYEIIVIMSALICHSVPSGVNIRSSVGGVVDTALVVQPNVGANTDAANTRVSVTTKETGIVSDGVNPIVLVMEYKNVSAATAYARNPNITAWATRVS